MSNVSDTLPSYCTVPRVPSCNDLMKLRSFGEQPINGRILNRPCLLTKSNAFVKSINAMKRGCCCSRHFSWIYLSESIISTVERLEEKPHCDSGYILSPSCCRRRCATRENSYPQYIILVSCHDNYWSHCGHPCFCTGL